LPALLSEAVVVSAPRPEYPRLSKRSGEEGSVLCRLHIDTRGAVVEVEIVESSGHPRLDEAAKQTLAGWRFEPPRQAGQPVPAQVLHRVTFRLTS
jgi:protein TonB